ncbi:hypothetical protein PIB30_100580, partial [Stylosanthes scabra]|nr:hypothetical protein [Stylosanthes scabra]
WFGFLYNDTLFLKLRNSEPVARAAAGRPSSSRSRSRSRGRGRAAPNTEHTPSPSPSTSTLGTSQVAPTIPPPVALSPRPPVTDSQQVAPSPQLNANSSHESQPDPPTQQVVQIPITWDGQKGFDPDNNVCTQAISDVIELMLNKPWINYSEIPADVQDRWFQKWAEGFTWPEVRKKQIRKAYDYRAGRRYQQIMRDVRGGELQRLKWLSEMLRRQLLNKFANDRGFKKRSAVNKVI